MSKKIDRGMIDPSWEYRWCEKSLEMMTEKEVNKFRKLANEMLDEFAKERPNFHDEIRLTKKDHSFNKKLNKKTLISVSVKKRTFRVFKLLLVEKEKSIFDKFDKNNPFKD